jgi:tetratricopeptide (TPR) repeat protein
LHRLSNRESLEIATHILGTRAENTLEELILEKTEGVPFFIEEFIKSLRDLKIVERKDNAYRLIKDVRRVAIPSTIQDVIMARVDSLPERAKEVLQIGSAIEREFSYLLIDRLTGLPEKELLSNLSILKDSELLYERGIYPQSNYIFKHALTREVVYDSLLAAKRKRFHEEIGKILEELYQDHLTDHYDALARHYLASENHQKAAHYSHKAARKAEKSASFSEAIAYEKQRVMSLERLPDHHPDRRKLIEARTMLGLFMAQIFDFREARSCIEPVIALASEVEDRKRLCQMQTILGCHHYWVREDFANAFKNLEGAVRTSMEIGDVVSMFFASQWLGYAYGFCCQFDKAERSLEKALEINFAANNLWGVCAIKSSIAYCVQLARGDISSGYETTEQAVSIAEKSGDVYSKAIAYVMHGFSTFQRGLIDDASEYLTKGIKCSEKTNFRLLTAHGRFILGHVHFVLKRYRECINQYVIAEQIWKECDGLPSLVRYIQLATILARVCSGKEKVEKEFLFQVASQNRLALHEGSVWRCVSNILIYGDGGALADAQYAIERAIEADARNGTKWSLAMDHATYAYILGKGQHLRESQENLDKATDIFRKCGAEGWAQRLGGEKLAIEETVNRAPGAGYLFVVP